MTWLIEQHPTQRDLAESLWTQIRAPKIVSLPGAYDGLSALLARQAGFQALYLSGAALSASRGWPDLGLLTPPDVVERLRDLTQSTGLPVLVDIDTGYGGVLNVTRAAMEMTAAGAAGVQMEDQILPKKCGHLSGKQLASIADMEQKVFALKQASPTLVVVARTDAAGVEGLQAAVTRAKAYVKAGADVIFPEALHSEEEFQVFREQVNVPLLANMTDFGQTPYYTTSQFQAWGYNAVIFPVTALRAAAKAIRMVYEQLQATGTQQGFLDQMQTRQELYDTLRYFDYESLDSHILRSTLPGGKQN
ncbi:methylisocitrate lyase [Alicyclobacillaceae bacterium I2511]|nr:methylisocitrate lyase [Alicyclobacillaceae bacterium I2511]